MKSRDKKPINLKLPEEQKNKFKKAVNEQGISMQMALETFVEAYITDPNKFIVKKEFQGI